MPEAVDDYMNKKDTPTALAEMQAQLLIIRDLAFIRLSRTEGLPDARC